VSTSGLYLVSVFSAKYRACHYSVLVRQCQGHAAAGAPFGSNVRSESLAWYPYFSKGLSCSSPVLARAASGMNVWALRGGKPEVRAADADEQMEDVGTEKKTEEGEEGDEEEVCAADEVLLLGARYGELEYVKAALDVGVPAGTQYLWYLYRLYRLSLRYSYPAGHTDKNGNTALHFAAANGHTHIIEYLFANTNISTAGNYGNTAGTQFTCFTGTKVRILTHKALLGNTPLHWAIENGQFEATCLLAADALAPILDANIFGVTPLDLAYSEKVLNMCPHTTHTCVITLLHTLPFVMLTYSVSATLDLAYFYFFIFLLRLLLLSVFLLRLYYSVSAPLDLAYFFYFYFFSLSL
jgi:hypothetical protein